MTKHLAILLLSLLLFSGLSAQYRISFPQGQEYIALDTLSDSLLAYNVGGSIHTSRPHPDYPRCSRDVFIYRDYVVGGKWGLMDNNGNKLTPPAYNQVTDFYGQILVHCGGKWELNNNFYYNHEEGYYGVLTYKGEVLIDTLYDEINYLGKAVLYYKKGKKMGLVHTEGKFRFPAVYSQVSHLNLRPYNGYPKPLQYFLLLKGKKGILVDHEGNQTPTKLGKYTLAHRFRYNRSHVHRAQFRKKDKLGLLDLWGNEILPAKYDRIDELHSYPYWQVKKDGQTGVVDSTGKLFFPMSSTTQWITYFGGKHFHYYEKGPDQSYGLKDFEGNIVVPPTYKSIYPFGDYLLKVEQDGLFGFLDTNGQVIIPPICYTVKAANTTEGMQGIWLQQKTGWRLTDPQGIYRGEEYYDDVHLLRSTAALVKKGDLWGVMAADGTLSLPFLFESCEKEKHFYKVTIGTGSGWVNQLGTLASWEGENDPREK